MKLQCGPNWELEEQATEILKEARRQQIAEAKTSGVKTRRVQLTRRCQRGTEAVWHLDELNDWLSEDQMESRTSREVLTSLGFPGEYPGFRGQYSRAYNPDIEKRPDPKHLNRLGMDPWRQQMWENVDDWWYHPGRMCYPRPEKVGWL